MTGIGTSTAVAAVLGVGTAAGLIVIGLGWRGPDPRRGERFRRLLTSRTTAGPGTDRGSGVRVRAAVGEDGRPGGDQHGGVLRLVGFLAATVGTALWTGWIVGGALAGLAVWFLPAVLGRDPEHARRLSRIEAVATWTEMLRDTLSAAAGLEQAILATAPLAPAAIQVEVAALAAEIGEGERLAPSLRRLGARFDDPVGDLVVAALVLASEQQTRQLAELLGSLADAARGQASMRMRVEAGRARTRTSVRVIVGTTLGFAVAVVLLNRSYMAAYDDATGQIVLLGIGGLFSAGFAWLARIARVHQPERFLADLSTDTGPELGDQPKPAGNQGTFTARGGR